MRSIVPSQDITIDKMKELYTKHHSNRDPDHAQGRFFGANHPSNYSDD